MQDKSSPTSEGHFSELWSVHKIRDLALRYAYAVDTRDWPLMESLWLETTPLGLESYLNGGTVLDLEVMRSSISDLDQAGSSTMFVSNHIIDFDDEDNARGKVYCHCFMDWGTFFEQAIIYDDVYRRVEGKWLFVTRNHLLWWGREWNNNPMDQHPADWPNSQVGSGVAATVIRRSAQR